MVSNGDFFIILFAYMLETLHNITILLINLGKEKLFNVQTIVEVEEL